MKRTFSLSLAVLSFLAVFMFTRCEKDTSEPETTPSTPGSTARFTWSKNGGTSVTADDAYVVVAYNEVYATKSGGSYVDISLDKLTQGTYNIAPSAGITLEFSDGSTEFAGKSGTVVITENTGTLISGNFNCTFASGGSISGEFSNLPRK